MRYSRWPVLLAFITSALLPAAALAVPSPASAAVNTNATLLVAAPRPAIYANTAAAAAGSPHRLATWIVRPGDYLSAIAVRLCGHANDWTGIYADNRGVIGANPDLILAGQRLVIGRCTDPPALLHLSHAHRTVRHFYAATRSSRTWKVTYGYPYRCGDGDNDGWDRPCGSSTAHRLSAPRRSYSPRRAAAVAYGGVYSFAGLEALWISAGGPAWAASHAAEIAECESGGRANAYNPSGATGLWQILGAVVPGNLYNPYTNALNAVAKFKASGDTFAQWVCR